MSIIDKIVSASKQPKTIGFADRQFQQMQAELAKQTKDRADKAKLAAEEAKQAGIDREHAKERRETFVRRDNPSQTALAVYDANLEVELQQRVIARTKPQPVQLNDGSLGNHPAVGKLLRLKAALKVAIDTHTRVQQMRPELISSVNPSQGNAGDYLKGRG